MDVAGRVAWTRGRSISAVQYPVTDLDEATTIYCRKMGLMEVRRRESETGRFTLVYLAAPQDLTDAKTSNAPILELTHNWDREDYGGGRNFGHLAFEVDDIYAFCTKLAEGGIVINRPPRDATGVCPLA